MSDYVTLHTAKSQEDAKIIADRLINEARQEKQPQNYYKKYLDSILELLQNQQTPIRNKFYGISVLKLMSEKQQIKFMMTLSGHPILAYVTNIAQMVDPKKPVHQKGLNLSNTKNNSDPKAGNDYMHLILECIKFWAKRYPVNSKYQPTKFAIGYNKLQQNNVVFPQEFKFVTKGILDLMVKKKLQAKDNNNVEKNKIKSKVQGQNPQLSQIYFRIQLYLVNIQDITGVNDGDQIHTSHKKFQNDKKKLNQKQQYYLSQSENVLAQYVSITQFLNQQDSIYLQYLIKKKDYGSYIISAEIAFEKIFGKNINEISLKKNQANIKKTQSSIYLPLQKVQQTKKFPKIEQLKTNEQQYTPQKILKGYFDQISSRSKSPGFKAIKQSLDQQKKIVLTNPPRMPRKSPSPLNKTASINVQASNLRLSKISSIFTNPPNPNLPVKVYDGKLIIENMQLSSILYQIKKQQGIRRFKIANFRQKNPLFENDHIQIGYKSQAVYQNLQNFKALIAFELFIGNKIEKEIRNLKISYKGDQNQLLYAHPKVIDSIIPSGYQNKHELMIVPIRVPFGFMIMRIKYQVNGQQFHTLIALPNSIMKLASYKKISKSEFLNSWSNALIYKTAPFKLSHYLAPDSLSKWIYQLQPLTKYTDFVSPGSITDYQLFCHIKLVQTHQGLLKIIIRPNLQAVIQIGILNRNQQSQKYYKFYLQTLQLILIQTEI